MGEPNVPVQKTRQCLFFWPTKKVDSRTKLYIRRSPLTTRIIRDFSQARNRKRLLFSVAGRIRALLEDEKSNLRFEGSQTTGWKSPLVPSKSPFPSLPAETFLSLCTCPLRPPFPNKRTIHKKGSKSRASLNTVTTVWAVQPSARPPPKKKIFRRLIKKALTETIFLKNPILFVESRISLKGIIFCNTIREARKMACHHDPQQDPPSSIASSKAG